jgi:hypothetical protein
MFSMRFARIVAMSAAFKALIQAALTPHEHFISQWFARR